MTRLSSIFSFKTLQLRPVVPRALLVALLVVASVEGVVRYRHAQRETHFGHSFVWLIKDYKQETKQAQSDTWLIGNSTLAAGIDEPVFEDLAGMDTVKMPHGSCNLAGYDTLLGYYLAQAPAPKRLIVFISKDDLSRAGLRAELTKRYLNYASESGLRPSHWLTLSFDREALRLEAADGIDALYSAVRGQPTGKSQRFDVSTVDATVFNPDKPVEEIYNLREAVRDWSYDEASLRLIVKRARDHGITEVAVVMMPITDALAEMHDRLVPSLPYEQVRDKTRAICEEMGVPCLDLGVASGHYRMFYDAFHVNAAGRQVMTQAIGEWVAAGMPAGEVMTEARLQQLAERVLDANPQEKLLTNAGDAGSVSTPF